MRSQEVESTSYDLMLSTLLDHSVAEIGVERFKAFREEAHLLDVRSEEEYSVSRMEGALHRHYEDFSAKSLPQDWQKEDSIVVYCSVGYRSEKVAEKLEAAGFQNVYNLYGGIFEYLNQGGTVVDENGPTQNIHPYSWLWGKWLKRGNKVKP